MTRCQDHYGTGHNGLGLFACLKLSGLSDTFSHVTFSGCSEVSLDHEIQHMTTKVVSDYETVSFMFLNFHFKMKSLGDSYIKWLKDRK